MSDALWIGAIVLAVVLFFALRPKSDRIGGDRARELVGGGAILLDVRSEGEFTSGHLQGARNVPVQALESRISELGPPDQPIVVYCLSGMRSARAARALTRAGFTKVYDLGSMNRW
jgi:rhodanese-related sulfurtransferase